MWLLALIGIGAAFLLGKKSSEQPRAPQRYALPPGAQFTPGSMAPMPCPPSPMDVLIEFINTNRQPPPMVVMCALAQVESMGRPDIAHDIIRMFVLPTVQAHQFAQQGGAPMQGPAQNCLPAPGQPNPQAQQQAPQGSSSPASETPGSGVTANLTDAQIQAMLNADPKNFLNRVQRGAVIDIAPGEQSQPQPPTRGPFAPNQVPMQQDDQEPPDVQVSGTIIGAAVASRQVLPSPIRNVDPDHWSAFTERLAREEPSFVSSKHVGRFRQRKERLGELGIDPYSILGNPNAQRHALDRDLADAYRHAVDSGMTGEHVNRTITLPGDTAPVRVTMSGVLGVIQAAGLEGAVGWLESYNDRRRFPHTTQAFVRTNNVF